MKGRKPHRKHDEMILVKKTGGACGNGTSLQNWPRWHKKTARIEKKKGLSPKKIGTGGGVRGEGEGGGEWHSQRKKGEIGSQKR